MATIVLGGLFMLTAGALGVVGTALVLLLVTSRGALFSPAAPHDPQAAVTTPAAAPIASPPPTLLPPPIQAEPPHPLPEAVRRDEAVSPVAFAVPPVMPGVLVPLAADTTITVKVSGAWIAADTDDIPLKLGDINSVARVEVTLLNSDVAIPVGLAQKTPNVENSWQVTVDRPGTYHVVPYVVATPGAAPTPGTTADVSVAASSDGSGSEVTASHFGFVVGGQSLLTKINPLSQYLMPRDVTGVTVSVNSTKETKLAVWSRETAGGSESIELVAKEVENGSHILSIASDKFAAGKAYDLYVVDLWSPSPKKYPIGRLVIPASNAGSPIVEKTSNHAHVGWAAYSDAEQKIANGYLKLGGSGLESSTSLRFPTFVKVGENWVYEGDSVSTVVPVGNGFWTATLKLPGTSNNVDRQAKVLVRLDDSAYQFAPQVVSVTDKKVEFDPTSTPSITDQGSPRYAKDGSGVIIKGTVAGSVDAERMRVVALDAKNQVVATSDKFNNNEWSLTLPELKDGDHQFRFALAVAGDVSTKVSGPITVKVSSQPPKVVSVSPENLGVAPGVYEAIVRFSPGQEINKDSAEFEANYVLIRSQGTGVFNSGGQKIVPETATLDLNSNSVKLKFASSLPVDLYQLRINGHANGAVDPIFGENADAKKTGLQDEYGHYLAGDGTTEGTDYAFNFHATTVQDMEQLAGLAGRKADVAGIPDSTGKPVDYHEFVKREQSSQGFNPADKVVTRVARLYYFRDAHRVVQVINRRAKSYNRQNSSMSRQLADQARLFAENTVDERRSNERDAVEAASKSRLAEGSLNTLQNALTQARNDARGTEALAARQQQIVEEQQTRVAAATRARERAETGGQQEEIDAARAEETAAQASLRNFQVELESLNKAHTDALAQVTLQEQRINAMVATIESLRTEEVRLREAQNKAQAREDRAVDHQFRLEVAAAKEDPDTYAPGDPESFDPVAQVSISVIGEGLIQLRGPLKGVNLVRTMINEIDTPVGQVRIGIHTVQVNGENGDRMEEVVGRIQREIDHSRFLTAQTTQMLRNAVVYVASMRAEQVCQEFPDGDQQFRDQKYQEAFFGRDFMDELREMDSEFLHTGNKVLSLHSMDGTSLASSLFLIGLASNDTRLEILQVFEAALQGKLPQDEMEYFEASDPGPRPKFFSHQRRQAIPLLAQNAKFVSFRGYFDHQVVGPQTLNPVQREFLRLAQIFKSRLITEIELKQRVMERALIEERVGDYSAMMSLAFQKESKARTAVETTELTRRTQQLAVLAVVQDARAWTSVLLETAKAKSTMAVEHVNRDTMKQAAIQQNPTLVNNIAGLELEITKLLDTLTNGNLAESKAQLQKYSKFVFSSANDTTPGKVWSEDKIEFNVPANGGEVLQISGGLDAQSKSEARVLRPGDLSADPNRVRQEGKDQFNAIVGGMLDAADNSLKIAERQTNKSAPLTLRLNELKARRTHLESTLNQAMNKKAPPGLLPLFLEAYHILIQSTQAQWDAAESTEFVYKGLGEVYEEIAHKNVDVNSAHQRWSKLRTKMQQASSGDTIDRYNAYINKIDDAFALLLQANLTVQFAKADAEAARRPLDHKKFLDMLIDEAEEKFIEQVEGTRSHIAVMDDYIKRLATALEDDFRTQFYDTAFRRVREQSYSCRDVQFGQIEHTTVLTNNREFAKVSPQATMEFDLPKRDTVLHEALSAAEAAYSDYGALLNDPNFIALTKMYSGQPTSSPFFSDGPTPFVRDLLPGLPSEVNEQLLIQGNTGQPQLASQLEALIPEPAIYKFETGTGFEIRPVIQPDGQSVVFNFNYMYTTNIREPVRADEKHLGRVKRHFINTDVQIGNYELREISRYQVALKAARTSRGIPLLEDVPVAGALFRPLPQAESSLQQNVILGHSVIYPTLFDLMGLRWAPAVADLDVHQLQEQEFVFRNRMKLLKNNVYDYSSYQVDDFLRTPEGQRRGDLYRPQEGIPLIHPNGYMGPGMNQHDAELQEYDAPRMQPLIEAPGEGSVPNRSSPFTEIQTLPAPTPAPNGMGQGSNTTRRPFSTNGQGLILPNLVPPLPVATEPSQPNTDSTGRARLSAPPADGAENGLEVRPPMPQKPLSDLSPTFQTRPHPIHDENAPTALLSGAAVRTVAATHDSNVDIHIFAENQSVARDLDQPLLPKGPERGWKLRLPFLRSKQSATEVPVSAP